MNLDLSQGLNLAIKKDEDECKEERLTRMLQWILANRPKFLSQGQKELQELNTDFVCFRGTQLTFLELEIDRSVSDSLDLNYCPGLLTTLCCCPFEQRDGFRVLATKFRKTIYLHKDETEEQKRQRQGANDRLKMMGSWGYKFEDFVLKNAPEEDNGNFSGPILSRGPPWPPKLIVYFIFFFQEVPRA